MFDGLEDDVLVQVASRMRQANLAEIMGRMDPVRARELTTMLADRARPADKRRRSLVPRPRQRCSACGGAAVNARLTRNGETLRQR